MTHAPSTARHSVQPTRRRSLSRVFAFAVASFLPRETVDGLGAIERTRRVVFVGEDLELEVERRRGVQHFVH